MIAENVNRATGARIYEVARTIFSQPRETSMHWLLGVGQGPATEGISLVAHRIPIARKQFPNTRYFGCVPIDRDLTVSRRGDPIRKTHLAPKKHLNTPAAVLLRLSAEWLAHLDG
jgi:hypothetical protein